MFHWTGLGGDAHRDFNGNNFDHTGLGFIRGGTIGTSGDGTPVTRIDVLPLGTPSWGKEFKEHFSRYYTRTMDMICSRKLCRTKQIESISIRAIVTAGVFRCRV